MNKKPPRLLKTFPSLTRNEKWPKQEFRVRIVRYYNTKSILLDVREYVTSEIEGLSSGYTKKGFSITSKQFRHLIRMSPAILKVMERAEAELNKENTNVITPKQDNEVPSQQDKQTNEITTLPTMGSTEVGKEVNDGETVS